MNVCVFGLWHLGSVTAACLADVGHVVTGLDADSTVIDNLKKGQPPLFEPGLAELTAIGIEAGLLRFTTDPAEALAGANVLWVTFDTPVDEDDRADVDAVVDQVTALFPHLEDGTLVLTSSQVPVGTSARLEAAYREAYPDRAVRFAYSPENLRLGKAIQVFTEPDRVVVGVRTGADRTTVQDLLGPITDRIEWMGVESAEMTKHALNAFLATSVAFINEIAVICERVGADAKEVERGLKSEQRIGPRAYLGPGGAFAGGTLARDIAFLQSVGQNVAVPVNLISAVETSNNAHKSWASRRLDTLLDGVSGKRIAVLGLTYKPGTDTLRRSSAVELCRRLSAAGSTVVAFDPKVTSLPDDLASMMTLADSAEAAFADADALVIATEWPDFREIAADAVVDAMRQPLVLDANRFLNNTLGSHDAIQYYTVGKPTT